MKEHYNAMNFAAGNLEFEAIVQHRDQAGLRSVPNCLLRWIVGLFISIQPVRHILNIKGNG